MIQEPKNFLVVGGSRGIGKHVTELLLRDGMRVTVAARSRGDLEPAEGLDFQEFDATDSDDRLDLPDSLDGLVYLPGTITLKPFRQLKTEDFTRDLDVNFFGAVRVIQQALPALKRAKSDSASIVLFSTVAVSMGMPFHASIASAKAAVEGLTRSLAAEFAPSIRVNAVAPSLTDTPLAAQLLSNAERRKAAENRHPLERIGDPAEIAELVGFLLGDRSKFVTGQIHRIDGGMSSVRRF